MGLPEKQTNKEKKQKFRNKEKKQKFRKIVFKFCVYAVAYKPSVNFPFSTPTSSGSKPWFSQ
jgi:hypothetical protein